MKRAYLDETRVHESGNSVQVLAEVMVEELEAKVELLLNVNDLLETEKTVISARQTCKEVEELTLRCYHVERAP